MKTLRLLLAFAAAGLVAVVVQAEEKSHESKEAKCCAKAEAKGEKCTHECCVEAAKHGDNCTKCGGEGKVEPKK